MKDLADNKTIDAFEKKAMTNAERQRKYRESQKWSTDGSYRLDTRISTNEFFKLKLLSKLHGNTKKETLENLIRESFELHVDEIRAKGLLDLD